MKHPAFGHSTTTNGIPLAAHELTFADGEAMLLAAYDALYHPSVERPPLLAAMQEPRNWRTVQGWGRPGDAGIAVTLLGKTTIIGAAWYREYAEHDPAWEGVDTSTLPASEVIIAVDEEFRSRGVGSLLMSCLVELAEKNGVEGLCLSVDSDNTAAQRLYAKNGFEPVATTTWGTIMAVDLGANPANS